MRFEDEFFKRKYPDFDKLIEYGFIKEDNNYVYKKEIIEDFEAQLFIDDNGTIYGRVMDKELDEEYVNFRVVRKLGEFAAKIKKEYSFFLEDIAKKCFIETPFISEMANELTLYIL